MPYADVNDQRLFYEDTRDGEDVIVFSHGYFMSHGMFDAQVAGAARPLALHRLGRARPRADRDDRGSLHVLGLGERSARPARSSGRRARRARGHVARRLPVAARRAAAPDRVRALVLIDTQPGVEDPEKAGRLRPADRGVGVAGRPAAGGGRHGRDIIIGPEYADAARGRTRDAVASGDGAPDLRDPDDARGRSGTAIDEIDASDARVHGQQDPRSTSTSRAVRRTACPNARARRDRRRGPRGEHRRTPTTVEPAHPERSSTRSTSRGLRAPPSARRDCASGCVRSWPSACCRGRPSWRGRSTTRSRPGSRIRARSASSGHMRAPKACGTCGSPIPRGAGTDERRVRRPLRGDRRIAATSRRRCSTARSRTPATPRLCSSTARPSRSSVSPGRCWRTTCVRASRSPSPRPRAAIRRTSPRPRRLTAATWVLDGHKWFDLGRDGRGVRDRDGGDRPGAPPHARASMVLVPVAADGFELVRQMPVFGHEPDRPCELSFHGVRCPAANVLGGRGRASRSRRHASVPGASITACARWAPPSARSSSCAGGRTRA